MSTSSSLAIRLPRTWTCCRPCQSIMERWSEVSGWRTRKYPPSVRHVLAVLPVLLQSQRRLACHLSSPVSACPHLFCSLKDGLTHARLPAWSVLACRLYHLSPPATCDLPPPVSACRLPPAVCHHPHPLFLGRRPSLAMTNKARPPFGNFPGCLSRRPLPSGDD